MNDTNGTPPDGKQQPGGSPIFTALFALTILGSLLAGLLTLHAQVQTLVAQRPHRARAKEQAPLAARASEPRSGGSRFNLGHLLGPSTPAAGAADAGAPRSAYELSTEQLVETYRQHYLAKGIRDEEYITLLAVNHADRAWSTALSKAEREMDARDFEAARQTLEEALAATDPRNLIGRARVLEFMRQLELRAGNPDRALQLGHQYDEARIAAAQIVVRACGDRDQGGVNQAEAQQLVEALKIEETARDVVGQGGKAVSDQGEDPDKAPERIADIVVKVARAKAELGKAD